MAKTIDELYQQYQSKQKAGASAPASTTQKKADTSAIEQLYQRWRQQDFEKNRAQYESSVQERLADLTSRQSSFSDAYTSRYKNRNESTYYGDYEDWYQKVSQERDSYNADVESFLEEFAKYEEFYDQDTVNSIRSGLFSGKQGYAQALSGAQADRDYYSNWETEEDFQTYLAQMQEEEAKKNLNLDEAQKEIDALKEELNALKVANTVPQNNYLTGNSTSTDSPYAAGQQAQSKASPEEARISELESMISQKEAYLNQAKRIQDGVALAGVVNNADFNRYDNYVSTQSDDFMVGLTNRYGMGYDDLTYEYINDQNGLRDEIKSRHKINTGDGSESYYEAQGYDYLTEDEIAIYNYYYAKEGKEKAEEYLTSIQDTLNKRKGAGIFEPMEEQTLMELAFGVAAGLDQFESGMKSLLNFKDDYIPVSAIQYASGMVREDLEDAGAKLPEWMGGGSVGQMGYDAITTTANMAPSILAGSVIAMLNPAAGVTIAGKFISASEAVSLGLMGAGAAGNAYQQALNEGYSKGQARSYGMLVGASEIVMEKLLGGISAFGGNSLLGEIITGNIVNADTALKMIAKRIPSSMISEFSEEYLQEVLDPVFENMILRTDNEVKLFSAEALYAGILGALTAGVMEGPGVIVNEVRTNQTGKNLLAEGIDTQKLAEVGSKFAADTVAYQLAGKVDENTGAYTIGRLFNEIGATLTEQNKSQITEALIQEGMPNVYAKKHAEILAYIVEGGEVSDIQMKMIESNPVVSKVLREVVINPNSTVYQRTMGYNEVLMQLAQEKAGSNASRINPGKQGEANVSSDGNLTTGTKVLSQSNYEASEDGKTILDGKEVTLDGIRKMADGTTMVATADNLTADPSEVTYPSKDHALVYESYVNLESTTSNPVIASMPVEARSALAKSYTPAAGVPAKVFVQGSNQAYWYGFEGISLNEKSVSSNSLVMSISKEQREFAYDLGRKAGEKAVKTQSAGIKAAYDAAIEKLGGKDAAKAVAKRNKGSVVLDDGIRKSAMTPQQKATYKLAGKVAQAVGTNIRLYHGMKEFGMYSQKNGEIWLNINAMFNGQSMMLFTLSHELVHMAKQWSPAEFNSFANELLEQFGEKGVSVEALIKEQMDKAKENGYELNEHEAYEEVIADACERMLLDSDAVQKMVAYKAKNPSRWQQIVDAITEFIANIRKLFTGAEPDSEEAALYKELDAAIREHLENKFVTMVMDAGEHMSTIKNAFGKDTVVEVNENGEFTLAKGEDTNGATKFLYNVSTWENGGRDTLSAALKAEGFSNEDIKAALTIMDGKHKLVNDLAKQFPEQNRINKIEVTTDIKDGHSVLSALVSNGDYPVNIDLLMVCKKRKAYQRVINRLCETGLIQQATVDALAIAEINKILGKYGFETACLGCFVESRRLRIQEWGNTIVKEWNAEVKKRNPNAKAFGFGKGEATLTPDEVMQLVGELESGGPKNEQGNLNLGQGSAVKRMGVLLDKVPSLRKTLSIEDLITPDGLTALRKFDSNLFSMVKSRYGSNSPKFVQEFNPYKHELAMYGKVPTEYKSLREYLYAIGGARMQSFSDFIVENWFDYCQIVADLAARKLPMHTYTKEIALVKLFGLTGIKINMSLIPDIDRSLGKEYAGLARNAKGELELIWADKDRFKKTGGKSYMQSINFADAIALQEDPRYSANVGTIAVGVSDNHILMMLGDPRIRMIIPYHSSGMNPIFADLMGTSYYKDYTNFQNTTVKQVYNSKGQKVSLKLDKTQTGKLTSGFQFNEVLQELGDARAAAEAYKDWCADASKHTITIKGETYTAELTPKFDDFSGHENYYKLLEDFNTYDCISEQAAPQGDVQQIYPEDFDKILTAELKSQEGHRQKQVKNQAFENAMGEIETYLKGHTKADTVFYAEQHGVKLGAKDKKLSAEDKKKLADLRKGTRFKMPKARDTEYLDAVKRGDMETAQKMVDEAAKAAGFTSPKLYHGTSKFGFTKFDPAFSDDKMSIFLSSNNLVAETYSGKTGKYRVSERATVTPDELDKASPETILNLLKGNVSSSIEMVSKHEQNQLIEKHRDEIRNAIRMAETVPAFMGSKWNSSTQKELDHIITFLREMAEASTYDGFMQAYDDYEGALWGMRWEDEKATDILTTMIFDDVHSAYRGLTNYLGNTLYRGNPEYKKRNGSDIFTIIDAQNELYKVLFKGVYQLYTKPGKQFVIDAEGGYWNQIDGRHINSSGPVRTRDVAKYAKENGYDSVLIQNLHDSGDYSYMGKSDVYIFFGGDRLKSADPVTYDDSGNVIPLSERFNQKNKDIRYKRPNSRGMSSRQLLADAFDELVQTPKERELMDQYRANITKVEEVQERLRKLRGEISRLTKANGDKAKINKLNETAADLVDLIDMYDRKLLELEASKPLRDVLARARTAAQKEAKQRNEEVMKEYRQQVLDRIDRSIESRRKTEMRKKIRKVIRDLNKILYQGDKKRNVKEDMKDFVAEALSTAEVLFTDNYTNEDIIRNGFGVELSKEEAKYAAEAQKILEELSNLPSGSYEAVMARQEAEATLKNRLAYRMSKLKDAFYRERQMLNKTEVATVLGNLADAYAKLETSEYAYVNGAYHEAVYQYLKMLQEDVGGSKVKDMTLGQLEELYKAYTMVLTTVRNANKMFAEGLNQSKEELANRVMMEVYQAGGEHGLWSKGELARNQASWNNTKPIYAAERTGSPTFVKLVNGLFKGQYAWAVDMAEAKAFRQKMADKYGFKKWDMEKLYKFTSSSGIDFELNLNQIMSLYAYAKREQAHEHLLKGGFVFGKNTEVVVTKNGIKRTYLNKSAKAHNISDEIMGEIISKLSPEQKGFVDEMQDYLSTTMGAKGNEVSMKIYGVKLFMEKFYFPLRSAGQFKEKAKEAELKQQQGQISIVNAGFTKAVAPKASNPVVLDGFMDVWAGHVNEMSLYHSMVLPMEDFRRVYNYASPHMEGQESASVNSFIENAYGDAATGYFDQLYKELNGGAIVDPRENLSKQMIGKFKKSAVMLSNSVWVQQFSAIGRAFALIDPKYFIGAKIDKKRQAAVWNEMKQNAPVTIIKEMGGFDTHTGRSAKDFLLAEEYGKGERIQGFLKDEQYRSEIMGMLPSKADELTWCAIWEAVKRETHDKHPKMDVKSEEFLKMVGERFSEVIERTQVYDSVLARSANMRSKQGLMQMVTAFMAEPTTTVNMIEDALRKGNKTVIARTFGAVAVSIILNNALASIVYAMRDDDEDETFLEKYAQAVTSGLLDDLNPMTYYPILKDIWSLFQGYDIERSDMAIYSDIADAVKKTASLIAKYDSDMDEEEAAEYYKKVGEALMSLLDAGASAFGVPLKNVRRDLMSYFNTINTFRNGASTTWNSFKDAVGGAALDNIPLVGLFAGKSKQDKLYNAIVSGDTAYLNRLKDSYSSETSYNTAVRKALQENDPRIKEAAEARFSGDFAKYKELFLEIRDEGYFDFDTIMAAVNAEVNDLEKKANGDTATETTQDDDYDAIFDVENYYTAVANNDQASASLIYDELVAEKVAEGYLKHEAEDSIATSFTTQVKNDYLEGEISRSRAVELLTANTENDETKVMEWDFQLEHGFSWSERVRKYRLGQLSEEDLISAVMEIEGESREGAEAYIDFLDLEMANDDIDITASEASSYFKYAEPAGIDIEVYLDYKDQASQCEGEKDSDGNTISGSKKAQILVVIDSMPISNEQKDALYFANGWAESKLDEAPWH